MLLLSGLWPGCLAALALGLGLGWLQGPPRGVAIPAALALATLALAGVAASGIVPGVPGLWLESAATMLSPYLAGCVVGSLARRPANAQPEKSTAA